MNIFNHRKTSSRQQQDPLSRRIWNDPYLDWATMLVTAIVLIAVMAFLGYRVYSRTQNALDAPLDPASGSAQATVDIEALKQLLEEFAARTSVRAEIIRGVGIPGDPSI